MTQKEKKKKIIEVSTNDQRHVSGTQVCIQTDWDAIKLRL